MYFVYTVVVYGWEHRGSEEKLDPKSTVAEDLTIDLHPRFLMKYR